VKIGKLAVDINYKKKYKGIGSMMVELASMRLDVFSDIETLEEAGTK